ncbi:MAG: hypothetical protein O7G88_15985 [bacterium]|nr:hypothetical protein [bacterium]
MTDHVQAGMERQYRPMLVSFPTYAWDVLAVREQRTRLEVEAERSLTPFVGRECELQILTDGFAQAQAGHGQVVFLVGEAGSRGGTKKAFLFPIRSSI